MSLFNFMLAMGGKVTYTLSGGTIGAPNASPTAGLRINTDSTVDGNVNGSYIQRNSGTDWVIPNLQSNNQHWVRFERISGDTLDFTGTLSTWLQCSGSGGGANREIAYVTASASRNGVYSAEIATDSSGSNIVVGPVNYTLDASTV